MPGITNFLQCGRIDGTAYLSEVLSYLLGDFAADDHDGVRHGGNPSFTLDVCFPFQISAILLSEGEIT